MSLSKKTFLLFSSTTLANMGALLTTVVLARFLSKEDLGSYKQLFLAYKFAAPIFACGLPASMLYFYPRFPESSRGALFRQTLLFLTLAGVLLALGFSVGAGWIAAFFRNPELSDLLKVFALYPVALLPTSFFNYWLVARNEMNRLMVYSSVLSIARFAPIVALALLHASLPTLVMATVAVELANLLYLLTYSSRHLPVGEQTVSLQSTAEQLRYAFPLGLSSSVGLVAWDIDKLVVSSNFSPSNYATYVVGAQEIPFTRLIVSSSRDVLLPEMAKLHAEGRGAEIFPLWNRSIRKIALVTLSTFAFAMAFSHEIIITLFSAKFADSVGLFRIYTLLVPVRIASYGSIFRAIGQPRYILYSTFFYGIINVLLNLSFVRWLGLSGPALATVIATLALAVFQLYHLRKTLQLTVRDVLPWKVLAKTLLASTLACGVALLLKLWLENPLLLLLGGGLLFVVVFLALAVLLGLLTQSELKALLSLQRQRQHGR